ncbi:MAG: hypothetical protein BZY80_04190 [SAR202 cluster bacterium Io17-Chloro-G2]|nr:MAG: hypothetical protein BZY80_04190 [SAR202 cluster bacterium Io17-Chloro-G2]
MLATIGVGTFMAVASNSGLIIALPSIAAYFHADLPAVQWVILGETLTVSALLLPMGRLSDILGRKRVYITGFAGFIAAAGLAGVANDLQILILAKVLQGAGSAMIQANGAAMIISVFPGRERGKALGSHSSVVGTGAIIGPALGGFLVSGLGWRWVFLINVPVGLVAILLSSIILDPKRFLPDLCQVRRPSFDWLGSFLSAAALLTILLALTLANRAGWASLPIIAGLLLFVGLLAAFIWWELRTESPMLDLTLFKRKLIAMGMGAGWLTFLGMAAARFMMAIYFQSVLGYSPREAGLIIIPAAIVMTFMGPISGRLSDRYGWRKFTVAGLAMTSTALFLFATTLRTDSPVLLPMLIMMLQSCGNGLFSTPNNSSILSAVDRSRYGIVSALRPLTRNSANITSIAVSTAIIVGTMAAMGAEPSLDAVSNDPRAFVAGLHTAFTVLGALALLAMFISFLKGEQALEPQPTQDAAEMAEQPTSR